MTNIVEFPGPPSYRSIGFKLQIYEAKFELCGTLDGFVELSIHPNFSKNYTVHFTLDEARIMSSNLLSMVDDIEKNCKYDSDPMLK